MPGSSRHNRLTLFRKGKSDLASQKLELGEAIEMTGPWQITFPGKTVTFGKLASWSEHPDPAIKYFAGAATVRTGAWVEVKSPQ